MTNGECYVKVLFNEQNQKCSRHVTWKCNYEIENGKGDMQGDNLDMDGRPENNVRQTES